MAKLDKDRARYCSQYDHTKKISISRRLYSYLSFLIQDSSLWNSSISIIQYFTFTMPTKKNLELPYLKQKTLFEHAAFFIYTDSDRIVLKGLICYLVSQNHLDFVALISVVVAKAKVIIQLMA